MMKKILFFILCVSCVCFAATTVNISVSADADIREGFIDLANGARTDLYASTSTGASMKSYMRFNLPLDFGTATSAKLKLVRTRVGSATVNLYYNLYGLNDGSSGQDWGETTGSVTAPATVQDGLAWNNAPANAALSAFTTNAVSLAQIMLPKGDGGGVIGSVHEFSGQQLADFINTDTDGVINLMINCNNTTTAYNTFASRENTTYAEPILELTYELGTAKIVELLPVADTDIRQDVPDYAKSDRDTSAAQNTSDSKSKKMYIKYQLPVDFDYATNVQLKIIPVVNYNTLWNWEYNIFALKDDATGNDWPELSPGEIVGQPYTSGLTWNNAPGNNPANGAMTAEVSGKLNSFNVFSELNTDVIAVKRTVIWAGTDISGI